MTKIKPIPTLNVPLLRGVKRHILEEPRRLVMSVVAIEKSGSSPKFYGDDCKLHAFAKCGTAACIGGWTCLLTGRRVLLRVAAYELGLGEYGGSSPVYPASRLFFTCNWPERYQRAYTTAKSAAQRARVTARRIEWFIKTGL